MSGARAGGGERTASRSGNGARGQIMRRSDRNCKQPVHSPSPALSRVEESQVWFTHSIGATSKHKHEMACKQNSSMYFHAGSTIHTSFIVQLIRQKYRREGEKGDFVPDRFGSSGCFEHSRRSAPVREEWEGRLSAACPGCGRHRAQGRRNR